jgi:hypothetical protein
MSHSYDERVYRSYNPQLSRYLHTVEQMINSQHRLASPSASRIANVIKGNSWNLYLKYEQLIRVIVKILSNRIKLNGVELQGGGVSSNLPAYPFGELKSSGISDFDEDGDEVPFQLKCNFISDIEKL